MGSGETRNDLNTSSPYVFIQPCVLTEYITYDGIVLYPIINNGTQRPIMLITAYRFVMFIEMYSFSDYFQFCFIFMHDKYFQFKTKYNFDRTWNSISYLTRKRQAQ